MKYFKGILLSGFVFFVLSLTSCNGKARLGLTEATDPEIGEPAPELPVKGVTWINSKPQSLKNLRGQVVLIDFWEYTCINCIRSFPFEKKLYKRYHNTGFQILGIHAPETFD